VPTDCVSGYTCSASVCKKDVGQVCMVGSECASTFCVDGVCCNSSCTGPCRKCSLPTTVGTCTNVPNGQDPDNECTGGTGFCNGAGACG
jgi:hypothetical protein